MGHVMRHEDRPETIPATVQAAAFPIYGIVNRLSGLSVCAHGLGISHLARLISVTHNYTSPRYPVNPYSSVNSENLTINSIDAAVQRPDREQMVFDIESVSRNLFGKKEPLYTESPFIWEGTLSIDNVNFSGEIRYWAHSARTFTFFLLHSEKTILVGNAYGPSFEELIQFLVSLQVINQRPDLLQQYQREFENQAHTLSRYL
jgi:hypothetical protein